ncbi:PQQ-dependent sugar dehydrogenase [Desulforhopalus singaporensis]
MVYFCAHCNPQGIALHPQSEEMWTHEHGPKGATAGG